MQPQKDRSTTSCTECQRRKQKCSREWPCNHCQARKVPHLCQFGTKKAKSSPPVDSTARDRPEETVTDLRGSKRSFDDSIESSEVDGDGVPGDYGNGLKMWGYMPGHVHYSLNHSSDEDDSTPHESSAEAADQVEIALAAIPPRSITDAIVNHFLKSVNYRYNCIYAPTFTQKYVQWWADRTSGKRLSPEFTCLLLRILSYSTQYLTSSLINMVEFELATNCQVLTERFSNGAEQLSKSFPPSSTSIERVQEQFMKGAWLKSEGKIVEAWHTLSCTIREAQELGIDKDSGMEDLSEFDIEIRRRLWALLFVWDWQMSAWLNRPHLVNQKDLCFTLPTLRLDQCTTNPNLLSPFSHIALQAELGRRIAPLKADVQSTSDCTPEQITTVLSDIENFIAELPPIFRIESTDHSLDKDHPYFAFQRLQLHAVIYMTSLDFVKPFLARDPPFTPQDTHFLHTGITFALKLLATGHQMFEHEFPINAKFHMVIFSIFDTATILCSALIHDREHTLPRREEALDGIYKSIRMLRDLSRTNKIGAASYRFLYNLVQASPDLSRKNNNTTTNKRHRLTPAHPQSSSSQPPSSSQTLVPPTTSTSTTSSTSTNTTTTTTTPSTTLPIPLNITTPLDHPLSLPLPTAPPPTSAISSPYNPTTTTTTTLPSYDFDAFVPQLHDDPLFPMTSSSSSSAVAPPFPATAYSHHHHHHPPLAPASSLELGGLEAIWDWEGLNLDFGAGLDGGAWLPGVVGEEEEGWGVLDGGGLDGEVEGGGGVDGNGGAVDGEDVGQGGFVG
ncbi:hypothetical protein DM02DRAFT_671841 [Periconia macrospinosa]|uniref:Zn(2)-C6 fungal-type domain-containing protein n=1 Tax=Periconia macrospinosa TaxID=97972 RepID=A0A2V1DTM9_9PLEO|nr:hypothetical protein DM02DRAFT_671841 [Periconia macrospinosa]